MNLAELELEFEKLDIPDDPIRLNGCTVVLFPKDFIKTHISYLKNNSGKRIFKPYYDRLLSMYEILKNR